MLAFRKSEEPDDWKRLMTDHLVRRTRSFIRSNYALIDEDGREYLVFADGSRFFFPERTARPVEHSFGKNDPAAIMASDSTLNAIDGLQLPRYNLAGYLAKGQKPTASERELIERLEKGSGHLIGFVRPASTSACRPADIRSCCRCADTSPATRCTSTPLRTPWNSPSGPCSTPC